MEITGRDRIVCEIALQDCKNDTDRAVNMLLENDFEEVHVDLMSNIWK